MSSLDDDLLSLVEEPKKRGKKKRADDTDSDDEPRKKSRTTPSKGGVRRGQQDISSDEDDDDEEDYDSQSDQSSDRSDESSEEEFDDGFDDDLMGDEGDRAHLMGMSEFRRQQILAERQNRRDAWEEKRRIRRILKEKDRQSSSRKRSRDKGVKETRNTRLKELAARRMAKSEPKSSQPSKRSEDRDSEEESSEGEEGPQPPRTQSQAQSQSQSQHQAPPESQSEEARLNLQLMNSARVSRIHLARWVHLPWFKEEVVGSFVRVNIGQSHAGENAYRIAEVVAVEETPRVYELEKTLTKKQLKLKQGRSERLYRMEYCSNSLFTESEFLRWSNLFPSGDGMPTVKFIKKKAEQLQMRKTHELTSQELQQILDAKKKLEGPRNPQMEKIDLENRLKIAKIEGNQEEISRLNEELKALEPHLASASNSARPQKFDVDQLNKKNQMEQVVMERQYYHSKERALVRENDPFARRPCQPIPFGFGETKNPGGEAEAEAGVGPKEAVAEPPAPEKQEAPPAKSNDPLAIHGEIDIDIDIDTMGVPGGIDFPMNGLGQTTGTSAVAAARSSMIMNFKKQRGVF